MERLFLVTKRKKVESVVVDDEVFLCHVFPAGFQQHGRRRRRRLEWRGGMKKSGVGFTPRIKWRRKEERREIPSPRLSSRVTDCSFQKGGRPPLPKRRKVERRRREIGDAIRRDVKRKNRAWRAMLMDAVPTLVVTGNRRDREHLRKKLEHRRFPRKKSSCTFWYL